VDKAAARNNGVREASDGLRSLSEGTSSVGGLWQRVSAGFIAVGLGLTDAHEH
jgi:hypothetical protein